MKTIERIYFEQDLDGLSEEDRYLCEMDLMVCGCAFKMDNKHVNAIDVRYCEKDKKYYTLSDINQKKIK